MYHYVLFDLDGTLTDPKEGICKSVQYALHAQNIEEPDLDKLEPFIGPPLMASFQEFYGMDETKAKKAVAKYRERFEKVGLYENEIYPGMEEFLARLQDEGIRLAVASSKPREFVEKILKHFCIEQYFEVVVGSEKDGRKVEKTDVIREALAKLFAVQEEKIISVDMNKSGEEKEHQDGKEAKKKAKRIIPIDDILMVGDRKFDILGAHTFLLDGAGVSYGYAPEGELEEAGADYITDNLEELFGIITGEDFRERYKKTRALQKSLQILSPIVYDFLLSFVILFFLKWGLDVLLRGPLGRFGGWFYTNSKQVAVYFDAFSTALCALVFAGIYKREKYHPISQVVRRRNHKRLMGAALPLAGASMCLALFLNILFSFLRFFSLSAAYEGVADIQYSVPMVFGLLNYGFIKPVEEELVFRGLVYGRMRKYFSAVVAIPVSALLFGAYHGNLVQLVYAFIMGCFLAYVFEKYKSLKASLLVHSGANLIVYITSSSPGVNQLVFTKGGIIISGLLTVLFFLLLKKKCIKKKKITINNKKILKI